ncbi:hypothetical protein U9M48_042507 [Paspalum notatum var. saurae]|uniref:Uncharacterized protein n=1 Tax=Paspalum notatum var. saurae TaxID=547442 RepID=A0AAQ3XHN5_PASNO
MALVVGDGDAGTPDAGAARQGCRSITLIGGDYRQLKEIELTGRQLTWVNNREVQTFEKMDRILVCTDWELKFPRTSVRALNRELSNHAPLCCSSLNLIGCCVMAPLIW